MASIVSKKRWSALGLSRLLIDKNDKYDDSTQFSLTSRNSFAKEIKTLCQMGTFISDGVIFFLESSQQECLQPWIPHIFYLKKRNHLSHATKHMQKLTWRTGASPRKKPPIHTMALKRQEKRQVYRLTSWGPLILQASFFYRRLSENLQDAKLYTVREISRQASSFILYF